MILRLKYSFEADNFRGKLQLCPLVFIFKQPVFLSKESTFQSDNLGWYLVKWPRHPILAINLLYTSRIGIYACQGQRGHHLWLELLSTKQRVSIIHFVHQGIFGIMTRRRRNIGGVRISLGNILLIHFKCFSRTPSQQRATKQSQKRN